ncbi:MAG: CoA-binding protein [Rhodomicrobium sp.]
MDHDSYPDSYIAGILQEAKSFALVGASANTVRPSYFVMKYLLAKGYRVFPVNPGLAGGEILGQKVFANLAALEQPVDVVDIFRNSDAALGIVREALALKERLGIRIIWMQLGVRNDEAARLAEEAGIKVVMNRCPKIEYGRISGEIAWAGVNNGMLSSRKPVILGHGYQQLSIRKDKP